MLRLFCIGILDFRWYLLLGYTFVWCVGCCTCFVCFGFKCVWGVIALLLYGVVFVWRFSFGSKYCVIVF